MRNTTHFQPHAILPICHGGGIEIMYCHTSNEVLYRFNFGEVNPIDKPLAVPSEGDGFYIGAEFYFFNQFQTV